MLPLADDSTFGLVLCPSAMPAAGWCIKRVSTPVLSSDNVTGLRNLVVHKFVDVAYLICS